MRLTDMKLVFRSRQPFKPNTWPFRSVQGRRHFVFPPLVYFLVFSYSVALSELLNPAEKDVENPRSLIQFHKNNIGEKENSKPESSEKLRAPGENQIHDPPSSSSDALATEPLEALCPPGSKFYSNYIKITQKTSKNTHTH